MPDLALTFARNEILLTGGNGFLGKVILALLLDRFPELERVHVLIRPRADQSADERFAEQVLDSPALQPLVEKLGREAVAAKVSVLAGDAANEMAGLDESSVASLRDRVGIVLNCAGLVEFTPPVDQSIRANVTSVERLLGLCAALGAKLLHVSTCYVAGEADGLIEETETILGFYPRRAGLEDESFDAGHEIRECREAIEHVGRGLDRKRRDQALIELGRSRSSRWGWANTYTYSKSLGEQLLAAQSSVDYAIVRPAIVESALRYPLPGWIEGGRTAAPLVLMALGGLLDWPVRRDLSLEVVPVDLIAAATLSVAGLLAEGQSEQVYQLASSDRNPYPLEDLVQLLCAEAHSKDSRPPAPPLWIDPLPRLRFHDATSAKARRKLIQRRIDRSRVVLNRIGLGSQASKLRMLELQAGFREQTLDEYLPFIIDNRYVFEAHNIRCGYERLSPDDRELLPWDPERIDWPTYWRECQIEGIKRWVQPEAVREWSFQL